MTSKTFKQFLITVLSISCLLFGTQNAQATEYDYSDSDFSSSISAPWIRETYEDSYAFDENGETRLTWNAYYFNSDSVITYEVEFGTKEDFSDAVTYTTSEPSLTLSKSVFGTNGGKFYFRVRACENGYNYSNWSDTAEAIYVKINKANFPGMYKLLEEGGRQMNFEGGYDTYTYDSNEDGWLDPYEIHNIWGLFTASVKKTKDGKIYYEPHVKISSLKGVEYLTNLSTISLYQYSGKKVDCTDNPRMHSIRISGITSNKITVISPTAKTVDVEADYNNKKFTKINLLKCPNAVDIYAYGNEATPTLILPKVKNKLKQLSISDLGMNTLDLNSYTNLQLLYIYKSDITKLKTNKCTDLRYLYFWHCDKLKSIDLSKNTKLTGLSVYKSPWLTTKTIKGYKNAKKSTINTGEGKWWYGTSSYEKLMKKLYD